MILDLIPSNNPSIGLSHNCKIHLLKFSHTLFVIWGLLTLGSKACYSISRLVFPSHSHVFYHLTPPFSPWPCGRGMDLELSLPSRSNL